MYFFKLIIILFKNLNSVMINFARSKSLQILMWTVFDNLCRNFTLTNYMYIIVYSCN